MNHQSIPHRYPNLRKTQQRLSSTYRDIEEEFLAFQEKHPKTGFIKVQTTTASQTVPVPEAKVKITKSLPSGDYTLNTQLTDISGLTQPVALPAPSALTSKTPGLREPFATYDLTITHPEYVEVRIRNVPVYENQTTLQPVTLLPKALAPGGEAVIEYSINPPAV